VLFNEILNSTNQDKIIGDAISRATSRKGLVFVLTNNDGEDIHLTSNVVCTEVFQNL